MKTIALHPDDVTVWGNRKRDIDPAAVDRIAASMADIGLRQPITVRVLDELEIDGEILCGAPVLVTGAHRLAAAKKLGWQAIDCIEIEGDEIDAELWEISENLHRLDLSKEQRDEHIRRYTALMQARDERKRQGVQDEHPVLSDGRKAGPQHQKSVARRVAEETGLSVSTVKRANGQIAAPPREVYDEREARRGRAMNAWNKLDEEDRAWFRDWIDTPIMDSRYD